MSAPTYDQLKALEGKYYLAGDGEGLGQYLEAIPRLTSSIKVRAVVGWRNTETGKVWTANMSNGGDRTVVISDEEARVRFPQAFLKLVNCPECGQEFWFGDHYLCDGCRRQDD